MSFLLRGIQPFTLCPLAFFSSRRLSITSRGSKGRETWPCSKETALVASGRPSLVTSCADPELVLPYPMEHAPKPKYPGEWETPSLTVNSASSAGHLKRSSSAWLIIKVSKLPQVNANQEPFLLK